MGTQKPGRGMQKGKTEWGAQKITRKDKAGQWLRSEGWKRQDEEWIWGKKAEVGRRAASKPREDREADR